MINKLIGTFTRTLHSWLLLYFGCSHRNHFPFSQKMNLSLDFNFFILREWKYFTCWTFRIYVMFHGLVDWPIPGSSNVCELLFLFVVCWLKGKLMDWLFVYIDTLVWMNEWARFEIIYILYFEGEEEMDWVEWLLQRGGAGWFLTILLLSFVGLKKEYGFMMAWFVVLHHYYMCTYLLFLSLIYLFSLFSCNFNLSVFI